MAEKSAEEKAKLRKEVRDRFGPKDDDGEYVRWRYAKEGEVWDAMRELEARIKALEGETK